MARKYVDFTAVGPSALAGRYLRRFWQPIHLSGNLPKGRPVPLHILDQDFTLFRGERGEPHLIGPTCAHRGVSLAIGRVEGEAIRCFYHGWKFDQTGQCVDQPAEKAPFCERVKVPGYPTREYLGLIFAYLGDGEPPAFPHIDAFDAEGYVLTEESRRPWPFFHQLENSVDEIHINFAHRRSKFTDAGLNNDIPVLISAETDYGIERNSQRGNAVRRGHILMPNCMMSMLFEHHTSWTEHIAWRVPIDEKSHCSFSADLIHKTGADLDKCLATMEQQQRELDSLEPTLDVANRILRGEFHADDLPRERPDIVQIQDAVAMMSQGPRDRETDILGGSDRQVNMLRRIWTRECNALAKGKPIKQWQIPRDISVSTGVLEDA